MQSDTKLPLSQSLCILSHSSKHRMSIYYVPALCQGPGAQKRKPSPERAWIWPICHISRPLRSITEVITGVPLEERTGTQVCPEQGTSELHLQVQVHSHLKAKPNQTPPLHTHTHTLTQLLLSSLVSFSLQLFPLLHGKIRGFS